MSFENDPRNIFVNQRNEYSENPKGTRQNEQRPYTNQTSQQSNRQTSSNDYQSKVDEMKRLAAKYEREGEGQLVKDIVNNVIEQKARGQLSNEQLITFANRVRPLLNNEQRVRLDGLLEQLLKI